MAMQRVTRTLQPEQLGLFLGLLLLAHLGAMAFSHHGMMATPAVQEMADLPMAVLAEGAAAASPACPGGFGNCMLAWRAPDVSSLLQLPSSVLLPLGLPPLLGTDVKWVQPLHALGPPARVKLQVLLQVFRM